MPRARLTKTAVDRLQAGLEKAYLWDASLAGFGVCCAPSGRKSFVVQYRTAGGRRGLSHRITIGQFGELTVDEARRVARRTLGGIAQGDDPAAQRQGDREAATVREALVGYLDELAAKKKPRTVYEWQRMWERDLLPALGSMRVRDVSIDALARLHTSMRVRPVLANRAMGAASSFLDWCERRGYRERGTNPARGVERFREQQRERFLSSDELRKLSDVLVTAETVGLLPAPKHWKKPKTLKTAKHRPKSADVPRPADPTAVAAIRLLAFSGMREQEALSLRWDAIDFERSQVTMADTKTGKSTRPLGAPALELLVALPRLEGNPYVFPGEKRGSHRVEIRRVWEAARHAAGLADVRLHDLRHTVASFAVSGGASLPLIAAILGHRDMKSTARYAHLIHDARREAADRAAGDIHAAMRGAATPVTPLRRMSDG